MNRIKILLGAILVLLVLGIVGRMDFDDEERERIHACEMIASGAWPSELREDC